MKKWLRIGSIQRWDEGLPLGNGLIGNLIYGKEKLIFSLDRSDLWDLRRTEEFSSPDFCYDKMLSLIKSGKQSDWDECMRLFDGCYGYATPTKINAGSIIFDSPCEEARFCLSMEDGVSEISAKDWSIKTFLSMTEDIGIAKVCGKLSYSLVFPSYYQNILGYSQRKEEWIGKIKFAYHSQGDGSVFGIAIQELTVDKEMELRFYVCNASSIENARQEIVSVFQKADLSFKELLKRQKKYWKTYWSESKISLPDKKLQALYEKSYYLFGSGNRKGGCPMPLQGLWTASEDKLPPWKGDYHHDLNTQFTYMSYLRANHLAVGSAFPDYLWNGKSAYEKFAKEFYGVDGLLVPAVEAPDRKPLGGWPMYSLSPTMSIWLAKSLVDYYEITGDENYLKERAYPFLEGVAKAIRALLIEKDGKYYLPLCSTPEFGDCTRAACFIEEWTNNDLQLVRYLFEKMVELSSILQKEGSMYEIILKNLPPILIDEEGILKLSERKYLTESHRHLSHLMCIYPLLTFPCNHVENAEIIKRNILDLEKKGTGQWVGFSFPWFAQLNAVRGFSNRALCALQTFEKCFVGENGFHLNGDFKEYGVSVWHYRPFTLEASFAYCDAIQLLLIQDEKGYLEIFPCIPDEWQEKTLSFENFRGKGGLFVAAKYEKRNITDLRLISSIPQTVKIKNDFTTKELCWSDGQKVVEQDGFFYVSVGKEEIFLQCDVERKRRT